MSLISATNLRKTYRLGKVRVPVLLGVDVDVADGEWLAVLGKSGSGKSTLLHLLGGLDRPDRNNRAGGAGRDRAGPDRTGPDRAGGRDSAIAFKGRDLSAMSSAELNRYRCTEVGFVFQFYHLLPELRVLENVTVGAMIRHGRAGFRGQAKASAIETARELLDAFGLGDRLGHRPSELSGGERQRVAIARALVNRPKLLLADEPTGNLDRATGTTILDTLAELKAKLGLTIVMVTHDESIAERADRVVRIVDGLAAAENLPVSATTTAESERNYSQD
ncbi:MAG: ABC transporter ATP-binding protein [Planctomycetota bacterium]